MRFPVTSKVYLGFVVLFLFSATIGISDYLTIKKQEKINKELTHSYKVINATEDVQNLFTAMENSRRGLRTTHQKMYLQPYYSSKDEFGAAMAELSELTVNDPIQSLRVALLGARINDIILFWSKLRLDEGKYDSVE